MAIAKLKGNIRVEGLDKLLVKLSTVKPVYAEPWKKALKQSVKMTEVQAYIRAPRQRNILAASVTSRLDPKPIPFWGIVTANAERKGYRYPWALEAGKGKKRKDGTQSVTHYRSGSKTGKSTKNWFKGSLAVVRKSINELLSTAKREIEANWGK